MIRSKWSLEHIVQALIDGKRIDNISETDLKIFRSYAQGSSKPSNATLSQKIQVKLDKLEAEKD